MKKRILISIGLFLITVCFAFAQKYYTRQGHIYFISHTEIIDIDANNYQVGSILNTKTGEMVFVVLMEAFEFELALAEEHFNENYVESHKYPKANFKGKITNMDEINFDKNGTYDAIVEGDMTIHGVTNKIKQTGTLEVKDDEIIGESHFKIAVKDYDIEIPNIVEEKVAKIIPIDVNVNYKPYNK